MCNPDPKTVRRSVCQATSWVTIRFLFQSLSGASFKPPSNTFDCEVLTVSSKAPSSPPRNLLVKSKI